MPTTQLASQHDQERALEQAGLYVRGQPDFEVFTTPMSTGLNPIFAGRIDNPPAETVCMVGSSTIEDLPGDTMTPQALMSMTKVDPHLTIFMNHDYTLPRSLYGSLLCSPMIVSEQGIADLWLASDTETENPDAMQTYRYVQKGRRIGVSGGFKVTQWEVAGDDNDFFAPLIIQDVIAVEFSLVGVPANQRCWVEYAAEGLFLRSLAEDNGEATRKLAPIVKGLFPPLYRKAVRCITSVGLQKDIARLPARTLPVAGKLSWQPNTTTFVMSYQEEEMPLTRDDIAQLTLLRQQHQQEADAAYHAFINGLTQRAATGKTSWPLADQGASWDGSAAKADIFAWAADDSEAGFSPAKAKQCFMYCDTASQDTKGAYKLPFCHRIDGEMHIIFAGVRAIAGVIQGARGGSSIPEGEIASIKRKVETIYRRAAKQYGDPDIVPPWKKEDGVAAEDVPGEEEEEDDMPPTIKQASNDTREEEGETLPVEAETLTQKADTPPVSQDGSHDAMTGTHSHSHHAYNDQGGDTQHKHKHAHKNDNDHNHTHPDDGADDPDPTDGSSKKSHTHASSIPHDAPANGATEPLVIEDFLREAYLRAYNEIGTLRLGFSAVDATGVPLDKLASGATHSKKTKAIHQSIHDMVCSLHPSKDGGSTLCESMSSSKDEDADDDAGEGSAGKQPGQSTDDAKERARDSRDDSSRASSWQKSFEARLEALTKALTADHGEKLETWYQHFLTMQKETQQSQQQLVTLQQQIAETKAQARKLAEMPVGRPTQLTRSVEDTIGLVTRQDLLNLATGKGEGGTALPTLPPSLLEAEKQTSMEKGEIRMPGQEMTSVMYYRKWPAGLIPQGGRPALTPDQQSFMHPYVVMAYQEGKEALVPFVDDPFEKIKKELQASIITPLT